MLKLSAVMIDHRYIWAYSSAMSFSLNVCGVGHRQACTLARRNAEVFLKYIHRNSVTMATISGHSVTVSGVTGVAEVTGHSRVPEQQVKGEQKYIHEKYSSICWCKYRITVELGSLLEEHHT